MKFTFKKRSKETGLRGVGHPYPNVDIKLNKQCVGWISSPSWQTEDRKWTIWVRVINNRNPNCEWRNTSFKIRFETEELAREWVNNGLEAALVKNNLILSPEID